MDLRPAELRLESRIRKVRSAGIALALCLGFWGIQLQAADASIRPLDGSLAVDASILTNERLVPSPAVAIRPLRPSGQSDPWTRRWLASMAPLAASQALDAASSYGMRELNPLLAEPDGRFGARAAAMKLGVTGSLLALETLVVRRHPRSAKMFTIVNWAATGVTTGFAVHNFRIR
jgi:hypothetical protein